MSGGGRAWWCWLMVMALAGCGSSDHPPAIDDSARPAKGGSRNGSGGGSSSGGAGAADTGTGNVGNPGNPSGSGTACQGLDSEHAHYYGTFEELYDDTAHGLAAIAPRMNGGNPCLNYVTPYLPTVEPSQGLVFIERHRLLRAVTSELTYSSPNQLNLGLGSQDDELIETPGCSDSGVAVFHVNPSDGSIIYNCGPYLENIDLDCEGGRVELKPFESACLDGPYYQGDEIVSEGTLGIRGFAADGRWVVASRNSALGLAYWDPATMTETPIVGERPSEGGSVVAGRVMGDGLSLVYHDRFDGRDHFYRVSVDGAGDATTDGEYGQFPTDLFWPYYRYGLVLDAEGDLYVAAAGTDSLAGRSSIIVKFPFGGDPIEVADNAEHPYIDTNNAKLEDAFVIVDLQSPLFSGPTLRF